MSSEAPQAVIVHSETSRKKARRKTSTRQRSGGGNALTQEEKRVGKSLRKALPLTADELEAVNSKKGLLQLLSTKKINARKALVKLRY